jgi:predicted nucleic acid-binding protein
MKLFLDANVLISVLNKEYPVYSFASRIFSLPDHVNCRLYTSPLCLAIAFYFSEKKSGTAHARQKIDLLTQKIFFTAMDESTVRAVAANKKIHDLEDGLQYYSAVDSGCTCIITEDKNDFYFSEIEVLSSRRFLENYVL